MLAVDWAMAAYVIFVALVAVVYAAAVPAWLYILVAHGVLVVFILALPPRGAAWERPRPQDSPSFARLKVVARFLRFGVVAAGLSVSCVYTRYHHGVDVLGGLGVAAIATALGYRLTRGAPSRT